ncbi:MAG: hypothetical protein [Caudoviricetes sp.]|nr:MAG: hypothetical protein [Caudoviricetes sp.]
MTTDKIHNIDISSFAGKKTVLPEFLSPRNINDMDTHSFTKVAKMFNMKRKTFLQQLQSLGIISYVYLGAKNGSERIVFSADWARMKYGYMMLCVYNNKKYDNTLKREYTTKQVWSQGRFSNAGIEFLKKSLKN